MTGLLFIVAAAMGMLVPVLVYSLWGSSMMMTGGLVAVVALLAALCLSLERDREARMGGEDDLG